jgi:hypothetical protein
MGPYGASVSRRGPIVSVNDGLSLAFLQRTQRLAICRAARDAHRAECQHDALECPLCQNHARAIADAGSTA